jgi:hypothetical protein
MPRKPFSKKYAKGSASIGPLALTERPEFAKRIGLISALWTDIDFHTAVLLAALLKADTPATVAVYQKLRRSTQRTEAIEAAFNATMPKDCGDLLAAFLRYYRSVESERNALIHNPFGTCDALPESLLWVDIQDHASHVIDVLVRNEWSNQVTEKSPPRLISDYIFYYEIADLDDIINQERHLAQVIVTFWRFCALSLSGKNDQEREKLFRSLKNVPPIAEGLRLQQERALRKNAQE